MASIPFSTLCLFQKPNSLTVSFVASNNFRLSSYPTIGFGTIQRSRKVGIPVCRATSVAFRDLDADDFRHPLDQQNTVILRAIPGLNELGKALLGNKKMPRLK